MARPRDGPARTEAHHLHFWRDGGPTDLDNALLLCRRHHTLIHRKGWSIRRDPTTGARLILMEPYMIEPDRAQPMRRQMDAYGAAVRQLAADYQAVLVPTQAAFDAALQQTTPAAWADDQIHPNGPGHAVIALAFLRAIDFTL